MDLDDKDIVQGNSLIRSIPLANNQFKLSLTQKRIIYYITDCVRKSSSPHEQGEGWFSLNISDLIKTINPGHGGNQTLIVLEELEKFDKKDYKIRCTYFNEKGEKRIRSTRWILEIDAGVASKTVEVHLPNIIVQQMKELTKNFTILDMNTALKAKSNNQLTLHDFLLSYLHKNKVTVDIEDLKRSLEIDESAYPKFTLFKKYVIIKCLNFINADGKIRVKFKVNRSGRTPKSITFYIRDAESMTSDFHGNYEVKKESAGLSFISSNSGKSKGEDDLNSKNKDFWEVKSHEYSGLMASTAYLQSNSGDIIQWNDDNFENKLKPYLKNEG